MLRGEIWGRIWPDDPEQKVRPLLIVSNNHRNGAARILDVVVVKITSLHASDGTEKPINPMEDYVQTFRKPSIIRCASIYSIEKAHLKNKLLQLTPDQMKQVEARLKNVLDLN